MSYRPLKISSGKPQIDSWVDKYARIYDLDPNVLLTQLWQESKFNPVAVSPAGAKGIAQFMPATAKRFGLKDPFDVEASIHAQAKYMRFLLNKFGDYALALAAYNAGEGNVQKYSNKIPPFAETRNYVKEILTRVKRLAGYNPSTFLQVEDIFAKPKKKLESQGVRSNMNFLKDRNTRLLIATFIILIIVYFILSSD
jgi:soluble lytic murein transglycosylase-like protein